MQLSTDGKTLMKVDNEDINDHGEFAFPNGVTAINNCAFKDCHRLKNLIIPEGVTAIGSAAFEGCSNLKTCTIPKGVKVINGWVFRDCVSLEMPILPEGVTGINLHAFNNCRSLKVLTIPNKVTHISGCAFKGCTSLETLILPETLIFLGSPALTGCRQKLRHILIASDDADQVARIKRLLPAALRSKVTSLVLGQQAENLKKQHLMQVDRVALAPALYAFFSLDACAVYKQQGNQNKQVKCIALSNDLLAHINGYLGEDNPYYQRAYKMLNGEPLPKKNTKLTAYQARVKEIADTVIKRASDFQQNAKRLAEKKTQGVSEHSGLQCTMPPGSLQFFNQSINSSGQAAKRRREAPGNNASGSACDQLEGGVLPKMHRPE